MNIVLFTINIYSYTNTLSSENKWLGYLSYVFDAICFHSSICYRFILGLFVCSMTKHIFQRKKKCNQSSFHDKFNNLIVIHYHPPSLSSQSVFPHPSHPVPQRRFLPSFSWIYYSSNSTNFWSWRKPELAYRPLHQCPLLSEIHSRKHWVTRQGKGSEPVTKKNNIHGSDIESFLCSSHTWWCLNWWCIAC